MACWVWFSKNVPRWSFITWLAVLERLSTKDQLFRWVVVDSQVCDLCGIREESHRHLFFYFEYSRGVWQSLFARNQIPRQPLELGDELFWKGKGFRSYCYKLSLTAVVCCLWKERNGSIVQSKAGAAKAIAKGSFEEVRAKLSYCRALKDSDQNRQ
ncbi:hypothetical protein RHSIM_Rhsim12G0194400 [Rhododendron simsii]|uniref:Reverse transcriptase zinc-binding domain-containing protein n=1 Tax=Rhododendron simsii TaxID=118357 RepID=A0A834G5B2_RHOSS|nr:hypothetical protein RHSIM_Rhsim12G0194400 [Rhododendron simsii]